MSNEETKMRLNRRQMLGTTAFMAAAGAVGAGGALTLSGGTATPARAQETSGSSYEVKPGELDEYYVFFSSGQSGEIRIVGAPLDARDDADPRLQPVQCNRLGPDQ